MRKLFAFALLVAASSAAIAQDSTAGRGGGRGGRGQAPDPRTIGGGECRANAYNCTDVVTPIPAPNTVWIEEMTWMDVRDALKAGKTTAIIATGGIEPNGPWLVTGKHNYVNQSNCDAIARKLGNALCAPLVKFTPEGGIDPQTSHMRSPGTISMREGTYRALLTDIVHSLKMHGFKQIFLIGDSGGNQAGQRFVADSLNAAWGGSVLVAHIQDYYTYNVVGNYMEEKGLIKETCSEGLHDDPIITLNMFNTDPKSVKYDERVKAKKAMINGVDLSDRKKTAALAKQVVDFRVQYTIDAMNKAIANKGTIPAPQRGGGRAGQAPGGAAGAAPAAAPPPNPASQTCSYTVLPKAP
jgi:creatinine amidohydrolase